MPFFHSFSKFNSTPTSFSKKLAQICTGVVVPVVLPSLLFSLLANHPHHAYVIFGMTPISLASKFPKYNLSCSPSNFEVALVILRVTKVSPRIGDS
jgi:hypothetical protein